MFPDFTLNPEAQKNPAMRSKPEAAEEKQAWERYLKTRLSPAERSRLEGVLLGRIKQHKAELEQMLGTMRGHWTYEDYFYRYYHGSFKVYHAQKTTEQAVKLLRELLPERELNFSFLQIIREGTGKEFKLEHNENWDRHTRPMLEAFAHVKFMVEMAVRYADLAEPPQPMPSGYAAFLYLYDLR